jgi:DNA-binding MarR family transcriptional regulator
MFLIVALEQNKLAKSCQLVSFAMKRILNARGMRGLVVESQAVLEKDELRERARAIVDAAIPYAIHRFSIALDRAKDQAFERDLALSSADWRILVTIGAFAPLSTKQLSDHSQIDKSTVSRTTASLVQRGFVARKVDSTDQRLVVLRLSQRGRAVCDNVIQSIQQWDALLLEVLSERQLSTLRSVLALLPPRLEQLIESDGLRTKS